MTSATEVLNNGKVLIKKRMKLTAIRGRLCRNTSATTSPPTLTTTNISRSQLEQRQQGKARRNCLESFGMPPYHTDQKALLNHRDTTTTKACRQNIRNLDVTKCAVGHAANSDTSRMNVLVGDVHRTINHHIDCIDNGPLDTRYWEHESGD